MIEQEQRERIKKDFEIIENSNHMITPFCYYEHITFDRGWVAGTVLTFIEDIESLEQQLELCKEALESFKEDERHSEIGGRLAHETLKKLDTLSNKE